MTGQEVLALAGMGAGYSYLLWRLGVLRLLFRLLMGQVLFWCLMLAGGTWALGLWSVS